MVVSAYESLVGLTSQLVDMDSITETDCIDISRASAFVESNQTLLNRARDVLSRHCSVPLRYEQSFFADHCDDLMHLRNLAHAFNAEIAVAATNGDYESAAKTGVEMLELANALRRGGLVVDLQVGITVSSAAMESLRQT